MVKSPPHIFDKQLFSEWPEIENDKLDLNSNTSNNNKQNEEKSVSLDFEVNESQTYSMYVAWNYRFFYAFPSILQ